MKDNFYKLHVCFEKKAGNFLVYYRTPMGFSLDNVAKYAVRDGELCKAFLPYVGRVEKITSEEYLEHMWDL